MPFFNTDRVLFLTVKLTLLVVGAKQCCGAGHGSLYLERLLQKLVLSPPWLFFDLQPKRCLISSQCQQFL